jgi:3-hydroxyisobutyrate dehydrogenase-like beta-hydroxyacid dehydrogenase
MARVAFLGLGVMGAHMAGHLARAGHDVTVFNRTPVKAADWIARHRGKSAATPREAAADAQFVFCCVSNDDDVREMTTSKKGAFGAMPKDAVFVDHSTASAALARELDGAARSAGLHFLDAPVSGGEAGARNGVLTVMVGGEEAVFERAKPVISAFARMVGLMGPAGSGQLAKMVNQICIAGLVEGLAEGLHFARNAGLDIEKLIGVISKGAAGSWQMENRWKTMVEGAYNHGFAVDLMRKDLGIVLAEARANGSQLPVAALVDQFYGEIQAMGGNRWDTSSLLARLQRK